MKSLKHSWLKWIVSFFLFLSGSAALIYQVLWVRLLSLGIGSTSASISTVLAAFFLGLGVGSYFAGHIIKRYKNAFKIYLVVEFAIALSAIILLPLLLDLDYYISMFPGATIGLGLKFSIVMSLLFIPTFLIGTTFPLLMSVVIEHKSEIGAKLAHFYAVNTVGAVAGVLFAGFVFIPYFGLDKTVYIAALLNLFIVLVGAILYRHFTSFTKAVPLSTSGLDSSKKHNNKALGVLFVTGFSSMATEVGWMKFLIVYTENTIYGFSLILAMFLTGITIGSFVVKSRIVSNLNTHRVLFFGLILLAVSLLGVRVGLGMFGDIYAELNSFDMEPFFYRWSKYFAMFLLLLPATLLFGALFPLALKSYTCDIDRVYSHLGRAYALNIIAGILGSLVAGFWIIPYFSTDTLLTLIALFVMLSSILFINEIKITNAAIYWSVFAIAFVFSSKYMAHLDYRPMIDIVFKRYHKGHSVDLKSTTHYVKEGQSGVVSTLSYDDYPCTVYLLNNGLSESWVDTCNEENLLLNEFMLGEIPFLLNQDAKKAFVVGYGAGTTLKALSMNTLDSIDVSELDRSVLDAVRTIYKGKLPTDSDNRVKVTINDARNTLLMSDTLYDIIVSQPSHPWLSGSSNIMSRDFFEIAGSRLSKNGIYAQWVPLFKIDVDTLKSVIKAYTDTFEYVISFVNISTRDFLMFGSKQPIVYDYEKIQNIIHQTQAKNVFKRHNIQSSYDLMRYFAFSREQLVGISSSSIPASDINLLTEVYRSRYIKKGSNSFDTLGFLKKHLSYDIRSYLGEKPDKKLQQQYYFFDANGYKNEAELLKKTINKTLN